MKLYLVHRERQYTMFTDKKKAVEWLNIRMEDNCCKKLTNKELIEIFDREGKVYFYNENDRKGNYFMYEGK